MPRPGADGRLRRPRREDSGPADRGGVRLGAVPHADAHRASADRPGPRPDDDGVEAGFQPPHRRRDRLAPRLSGRPREAARQLTAVLRSWREPGYAPRWAGRGRKGAAARKGTGMRRPLAILSFVAACAPSAAAAEPAQTTRSLVLYGD